MTDSFSAAVKRLLAMPAFATSGDVALKPGLDRIRALLAGMGHPERDREIILVAGTNGKGSTASMLAALSTAAGVRTGLHTSPHLLWVGERMRVDGIEPSEEWLAETFENWESLFDRVKPSFFEATLALSFAWFADQGAERWVVEIGLGGRLDAANVLDASVGILTSVGRDHMHLLGPTLSDVSREKAAIARPGRPFVLGPLEGEARAAALETLREIGTDVIEPVQTQETGAPFTLRTSKRSVSGVQLSIDAPHQRINALLALQALDLLHAPLVPETTVKDGFYRLSELSGLRGRQDWVNETTMVDVCHNEDALQAALSTFIATVSRSDRDEGAVRVVLGFLADKELGQFGTWLARTVEEILPGRVNVEAVGTAGARGQRAAATERALIESGWNGPIQKHDSVEEALSRALSQASFTFIGGSYLVAASALEWLIPGGAGSRKLPVRD